jgi:hypothetical protein
MDNVERPRKTRGLGGVRGLAVVRNLRVLDTYGAIAVLGTVGHGKATSVIVHWAGHIQIYGRLFSGFVVVGLVRRHSIFRRNNLIQVKIKTKPLVYQPCSMRPL